MKKLSILLLTLALLASFSGCGNTMDQAEDAVEKKLNEAVNALRDPSSDTASGNFTPVDPSQLITPQEAEAIALEHAGVTADEAVGLHTVMEIDNGRQEYDVEFRSGHLEYEYEIDAASGTILSYSKDD